MTEIISRRASMVTPVPLGSELVDDATAGDTLLTVIDSGDFDETGTVLIDEVVYAYVAMEDGEEDDDPDPSITLDAPGLAGDLPAGTRVEEYDPANEALIIDYMVQVTDDADGSTNEAYLHHTLIPMLPEGLPPGVGDSVEVTIDDLDNWTVTNVYGREAQLNPLLLTDAVAPADSPVLTAVGLLETFLLYTTPVDARTQLTYQVSTDYDPGDPGAATWTDLPDMPVRTTVLNVKRLPDDTTFDVGVDYTFRVIASNDAGEATASDPVTEQLNTDAAAVVASQVIAAEIIAGFALLGTIHVGGDSFTLTPPDTDPENLPGGLLIVRANGDRIHLPADALSPILLHGDEVVASHLTVVEGADLQGASNLSGTLSMDSTIANPSVAPTVSNTYDSLATGITGPSGFCRNIANDGWIIAQPGVGLFNVSDAGVVVDSVVTVSGQTFSHGITKIGSTYYGVQAGTFSEALGKFNSSLNPTGQFTIAAGSIDPGDALGTDGTNFLVGHDDGTNVVITRYATTVGGPPVDASANLASAGTLTLGGVFRGSADFGVDRWVVHPKTANVRVFDTGSIPGARQTAQEWPRPQNQDVHGLWWDGTYFWVIDNSGVIRRLEPIADAPAADYDHAYAWSDSDTHTTLVSPITTHSRKARARLAITATNAPQEAAAGTHVANRVAIYSAPTSGTLKMQGGGALAVGSKKLILTIVTTGGSAAPGSNNWSAVFAPAVIAAEGGGWTVDGSSNGSIGTGTFRDSVDARVTAGAGAGARLFAGTTATAGGTAAKTATIAGYVPASGDTLALKLTNGNSAASPTLNINGGGAKAIQLGGAAVGVVGGASAGGTIWALRYDGTVWHLAGAQSPHANTVAFAGLSLIADRLPYADGSGTLALATFTAAARALLDDATAADMLTTLGIVDASATAKGIVELATNAEAVTGTDTVRAVTPAGDAAALAAYVPAASETASGKAEIATQAEVTTGTDDLRIVTPLKLATAVPVATETAAGKLEIATQAEVTTGTDDARAVTPLKLATAVPAATETAAGKAEIATQGEVNTGTDDSRFVTPLKLAARFAALVVDATTTVKGIVQLATNAEAITGTDTVRAVVPAALRAALNDFVITGTTTNFNAIANNRNTVGKYAGRLGFNTTTNKLIVATGATAASTWVNSGTGVVEHTPV